MMVADNFDDKLFFLDQQFGKIYCYIPDDGGNATKVFDMDDESTIPDGLTLDWLGPGAAQTNKVHMVSQGKTSDEIYVVFQSTTLPTSWTEADAPLPPPGAYPGYMCKSDGNSTFVRDIYRVGEVPSCVDNLFQAFTTFTIYNVFYKFTLSNGKLTDPVPFFVLENQLQAGHLGGGMTTIENGKILWSVGDCLYFGADGRFAPQKHREHCGKILLIDPDEPGKYQVAAMGVRNSQQMRVMKRGGGSKPNKDILVFMDIGGVTAEEVNAISLSDLMKKMNPDNRWKKTANFGWGRSQIDGKTREGTCYVGPGNLGVLGVSPPVEDNIVGNEAGFIAPWIQFGRSETDFYYAISSFVVASKSLNKLKLIWSEMNTGHVMGTKEGFGKRFGKGNAVPSKSYKFKIFGPNNTDVGTDNKEPHIEYSNGLNHLVTLELGVEATQFVKRGDPRLFHYPDGTAGVFIERTGVFYRLTEIKI